MHVYARARVNVACVTCDICVGTVCECVAPSKVDCVECIGGVATERIIRKNALARRIDEGALCIQIQTIAAALYSPCPCVTPP